MPVSLGEHWSNFDRLEFAVQKLKLAQWQYQRLEDNITLSRLGDRVATPVEKIESLLQRLRNDMFKFGMTDSLVKLTIDVLQSHWDAPPESTVMYHDSMVPPDLLPGLVENELVKLSQAVRFPASPNDKVDISNDPNNHTIAFQLRPDIFAEILFKHSQTMLQQQASSAAEAGSLSHGSRNHLKTPQIPEPEHLSPEQDPIDGTAAEYEAFKHEPEGFLEELEDGQPEASQGYKTESAASSPNSVHSPVSRFVPSIKDIEAMRKLQETNVDVEVWLKAVESQPLTPYGLRRGQKRSASFSEATTSGARSNHMGNAPERKRQFNLMAHARDERDKPSPPASPPSPPQPARALTPYNPTQHQQYMPRAPPTSNAAVDAYNSYSSGLETSSNAATWGSASNAEEFNFQAYLERRQQGIDGRKRYFALQAADREASVVSELLKRWTVIDEPVETTAGKAEFLIENEVMEDVD